MQRRRRTPETHLEAERWNAAVQEEAQGQSWQLQYIVTVCPRERAIGIGFLLQTGLELLHGLRSVEEINTQYEGIFSLSMNCVSYGTSCARDSGIEQGEVNKSGTAKVNSLSSLALCRRRQAFLI
ncbi:hypothetical protein [Paenibacillus silvae]|uniref:hypothetical protein n=1 Tax=Paenibacillus silvae TaxID=1325358 RepID=UPI003CFD19CE